ncbi:hypothetical protein [Nannocystis sp.]|uniref:hypothetical protein n=1 Tax=Nannocystis sp. TaxID=1962667 RepID=UPI0025F706D3|nr:hypothetical protein [Nannocystis sp.]MBK7828326.1 hypothetical protein [Nannocystis sp.]
MGDLVFGTGHWLDVMSGKELLRATIGPSMRVKDRAGKFLQGERLAMEVAKSLLRLPLGEQPRDFQEFVGVLGRRLQSPAS